MKPGIAGVPPARSQEYLTPYPPNHQVRLIFQSTDPQPPVMATFEPLP